MDVTMDVGGWLRSLGLEKYEAIFRENEVDDTVLPSLTAEDLKDLGVGSVGHRRKLLDAIAALRADAKTSPQRSDASPATEKAATDTAGRRQVTVMFSDLVGSTALSARMDPEDLREIISVYQRCVADIVRRFGGFVARYMGDGVLIYFGYPTAHEDDAERAVRSGLALIDAVAALRAPEPLQVRIGVATGTVVVGDLVGSSEGQEHDIVGETPNLAARLQAIAEPDTVIIAEATHRLLGNLFELQDLGPTELKGIAGPVKAFAVRRPRYVESRFEALHSEPSKLVGREEELWLLHRRWNEARAGEGQLTLISGEPGIGKSRLAFAFREKIKSDLHHWLLFQCSPHRNQTALYPVINQLERAARFSVADSDEAKLEKLAALLAPSPQDLTSGLAMLAELLSIRYDTGLPALSISPQRRKELMLEQFVAHIAGLSAQKPILIVLEDAHWIDPTTQELFDIIVERMRTLPVLLILTHRPEFAPPWLGQSHVTVLALNRLGRRENAAMIRQVAKGKDLPAMLLEQIVTRTDGVPLFIEEVTKSVLESDVLREENDAYVMVEPLLQFSLPPTLQASLIARLDRLASLRTVVQAGAAFGREFAYPLMRAVCNLSDAELEPALDQLAASGLVHQRGSVPHSIYTFKHALVQDAAYSTMLRSQRVEIHGRIVEALERQFPEIPNRNPDTLAYHCTAACFAEKAIDYWLKSARLSLGRSAGTEAQAQLERATVLLRDVTDPGARQQFDARIQVVLGDTFVMTKGFASPDVANTLTKARALLDESAYPLESLHALGALCNYHLIRSEAPKIVQLAQPFVRRPADPLCAMVGHYETGVAYLHMGKFEDARLQLEEALSLYDEDSCRPIAFMAGVHVRAFSLVWLSLTYLYLGKLELATETIAAAVSDARGRLHPFTLVSALLASARFYIHTRDRHKAVAATEEGFAIANEQRSPYHISRANVLKAVNLVEADRAVEGISLMEDALVQHRKTGANFQSSFNLSCLAGAYARAEKYKRALEYADQAIEEVERTGERWWAAEAQRAKGRILLAANPTSALQAESCFRAALDCAKRQDARFWELRAAYDLARLCHTEGRSSEARSLLSPYAKFANGVELPDLDDARRLSERLRNSGYPQVEG
jgi:class 3 adenylate cyclase/tetratricopeptide (TPR) repeat protein